MPINYVKIEEGTKVQTATKQKPVFGLGNTRTEVGNPDVLMGGEWFNSVNGDEKVVNGNLIDNTGWTVVSGNVVFENEQVTISGDDSLGGVIESTLFDVVAGVPITIIVESYPESGANTSVSLVNSAEVPLYTVIESTTDNGTFVVTYTPSVTEQIKITLRTGSSDSLLISHYSFVSIFEKEIIPDTPYNPQITYLDDSFEIDIDGNIAVIHNDFKVPDIAVEKIHTKDLVVTDVPRYFGYLGVTRINDPDVILPWATEIDTHSAMNSGIWTCPKSGMYGIDVFFEMNHISTSPKTVEVKIVINGVSVEGLNTYSDYTTLVVYAPTKLVKIMNAGDTLSVVSVVADSEAYIDSNTKISIDYLGEN